MCRIASEWRKRAVLASLAVLVAWPARAQGLVGHWKLDETTDTTAADETGANDGIINGDPTLGVPGKVATAFDFDGVDDYVDLGTMDVSGSALTLAGWFQADAFQEGRIVSKAYGIQENEILWMLSTYTQSGEPRLRFRVNTDGTPAGTFTLVATSGTLTTGVWYHAAAVYDGAKMLLYLNGTEVGSADKTGTIGTDNTMSAYIGANPQGRPPTGRDKHFDGLLDDVRVYDEALDATAVMDLFLMGEPMILNAEADDPDDGDDVLGADDTITIVFDVDTNTSMNGETKSGAEMDGLFPLSSSHTWGTASPGYTLAWLDAKTLEITVDDATDATVDVGDTITVDASANIKDPGEKLPPFTVTSPAITGDWGWTPATGLVAHWKLDETAGTTATDETGNHNGITSGATVGQEGKVGTAYRFDGTDDKVDVAYSAELNPDRFGFALWAKPSGGSDLRSPLTCRDTGSGYMLYETATDAWSFWIGNGTDYTELDGPAVKDGQWQHVACTYDGSTMTMYVDGTLAGSAASVLSKNVMKLLRIGAGATEGDGDHFYQGLIDDVRVYGVALDEAAVLMLHGMGAPIAVSAAADDPDNVDAVLGAEDTITITFDIDTNKSMDALTKTGTEMDGLFKLSNSHTFGGDTASYTLSWSSADTLVITVDDATDATVDVDDTIAIDASANVKNAGETSAATVCTSPPITGNWGRTFDTSLIAHWKLDETTGTVAADSSSYGDDNKGTLTNMTADACTTDGVDGTALIFAGGTTDVPHIEVADSRSLRLQEQLTILAWINPDASLGAMENDYPAIVDKYGAGMTGYVFGALSQSADKLGVKIASGGTEYILEYDEAAHGEWIHVVAIYDGADLKLYRNAEVVRSKTVGAIAIDHNTGALKIGEGFAGKIDDVRIYGWALDPLDILDLYNVSAADYAPKITSAPPETAPEGELYTYTITVTGKPAPTITVETATGDLLPAWLNFDDVNTLSGTPEAADAGVTELLVVTATNDLGTDTQYFCIVVGAAVAADVGLVGWWKFDETEGTTATDSSPLGNHGAVNGATWVAGKVDGALSFTGTDSDYVEIPNEADYDLGSAVSYVVWIKADSTSTVGWSGVITKGDNMNLQRFGAEDVLVWQTRDSPATITNYHLEATTPVFDDQWHHIAVTFDGSEKHIYVDGALDNLVTATGTINTSDYPIVIGKNMQVSGHPFDGLIDDVRIYNRAVTADEVKRIYGNITLSVEATDPDAKEGTPPDTGTFTVTRTTGDPSTEITVLIAVKGDAARGASGDYTLSVDPSEGTLDADTGELTILADVGSVVITVTPVDDDIRDDIVEPTDEPEAVCIVILDSTDYGVTSPRQATVFIEDDDTVPHAFNLLQPADESVNATATPTLTWQPAAKADTYTVVVASDDKLADVVHTRDLIPQATQPTYDVPDSGLEYDTVYYWNVTAQNDIGDTKSTNGPWSFNTSTMGPPKVDRTSPRAGEGDVSASTKIRIFFSEPMDASVVDAVTVTGVAVTPNLRQDGMVLTLTPAGDLSFDKKYTVTVEASLAKDRAGNAIEGDNYVFSFVVAGELVGLAWGEGCVPGAAGAAWLALALTALSLRRKRS